MNPATQPLTEAFTLDLQEYLTVCETALSLVSRENQALSRVEDYSTFDFHQQRKNLLPTLETSLNRLRTWRVTWQQSSPEVRAGLAEARVLFQRVQEMLMKIVLLDRDNQQALLRRGLVPAQHLPRAAGQQPHFVAGLYKRHRAD